MLQLQLAWSLEVTNEVVLFVLGFNAPYWAMYSTVIWGYFETEGVLVLICLGLGVLFVLFWLVALVSMPWTKLYRYLMLLDPCCTLVFFALPVIFADRFSAEGIAFFLSASFVLLAQILLWVLWAILGRNRRKRAETSSEDT